MPLRAHHGCFAFECLVLAGTCIAALGACSSANESGRDATPAAGGASNAGGNASYPPTTSTTGTSWGAGGSGGGYAGEPGSTSNPYGTPDAGTDAAPVNTCDGLDATKPLVLYISADDSNSMASPVHARESLTRKVSVPFIRTYEFLNYYSMGYAAPSAGQLALYPQGEAGSEPGTLDVQIGLRSFNASKPRRPMTITFVLDTSGSMEGDSLAREQAVVKAVAKSLAPDDIVSVVTWNDTHAVVLEGYGVKGPNDPVVIGAADGLFAGGSTDLNNGLITGYDLAKKYYGSTRLNRVILVSDGGANTGVTDEQLIAVNAEDADKEGIYMVGVGTGPAFNYNDVLMDTVTDKGRGAYVYIDGAEEAERIFVDRFDEVMEVAARSVQVQLTLPWYFQMQKFYGEGYSTDPKEIPPQHLAPSDAMVFNQVLRACDPALIQGTDTIQVRATWQAPLTYVPMSTEVTLSVDELLASPKAALHKGKAVVAYAEALKSGLAEDLAAAHDKVLAANPGGADAELTEIASLLVLHPSYPH